MKNRFLLLTLLLVLTSCAQRYLRPDATPESVPPDVHACAYEAHKADRWGDDQFIDACMKRKGYLVDPESAQPIGWFSIDRDKFRRYDTLAK